MRIGIDCRTILDPKSSERAGVAHYSYYLLKYLLQDDRENDYVLFFPYGKEAPKEFLSPRVRVVYFSKKRIPFFHSHYILAKEIAKEKLDIFHSLSGILPLWYKGKSVITIADLAMYMNPKWFSPKKFFGDFFWRKILIPRSIKKAEKIIVISENTKRDITKYFHIDEKKITVTYLGVEVENISGEKFAEILKKFDLADKKYFLFIGTIEPRKNIINIVNAFEEFMVQVGYGRDRTLQNDIYYFVLAGGLGWKYEPILDAIKKSSVNANIKYIGYVSAEEKSAILKNSLCFVWPSLYEGFGLPILEAMACGSPVISSNTSSIPEVAGNAAILVDPNDESAISKALMLVATDKNEQKKLRELGAERIKLFSWNKTARKTLDIYRALR